MASSRRSDLIVVLFIAAGLALCYVLRGPLVLIYVSIIFAVIFAPIVERIHCVRIRRWSPSCALSRLLLLPAVLIAVGAFFALAVPPIVNESKGLSHDLPSRLNQPSDR